ncbi:Hypothetical predicted protein, partial [Marmota monax]
ACMKPLVIAGLGPGLGHGFYSGSQDSPAGEMAVHTKCLSDNANTPKTMQVLGSMLKNEIDISV